MSFALPDTQQKMHFSEVQEMSTSERAVPSQGQAALGVNQISVCTDPSSLKISELPVLIWNQSMLENHNASVESHPTKYCNPPEVPNNRLECQ